MPDRVQRPVMSAADAAALMHLFKSEGIEVYVDGGWAVDALLGVQTRPHRDLDIALPHHDVPRLRALLDARGYKEVPHPDSWECNIVLGDAEGHEVDVHSYVFDDAGHHVYGVAYQPAHLTGVGLIAGYQVACTAADALVAFHTGYALDADDYHDVKALCDRFGLPLPLEHVSLAATLGLDR